MRDKAISEMRRFYFPWRSGDRSAGRESAGGVDAEIQQAALQAALRVEAIQDVEQALRAYAVARRRPNRHAIIVITGSIYLVGEAMRVIGVEV